MTPPQTQIHLVSSLLFWGPHTLTVTPPSPYALPLVTAFGFMSASVTFRGQLLSPLHLWIKDIIIKLAFALFHVCPGSPSPLSSQGHISEFFIPVLAKMGKIEPGVSLRCLTNLIHICHISDFLSSSDSSHRNWSIQSRWLLAVFILGLVICDELEPQDINRILIKSLKWTSMRI